jgi:hypothetical protein
MDRDDEDNVEYEYSTEKEKKYNLQMVEKAFDLRQQARKTVNLLSAVLFTLLFLSLLTLRDSFTCAGLD